MPHRYDPAHWRERAAQMRLLASEMNDPEAGAVMLKPANDYDKLADRVEERAQHPQPESKKNYSGDGQQKPPIAGSA